jgi:PAS domain S-box-containing protein
MRPIMRDPMGHGTQEKPGAAATTPEGEAAVSDLTWRFRAMFNSTVEFMGLLDPGGTVLEANETALRLIGRPREAVIGRPFWSTPWWTDAPEEAQRVRAAVAEAASGRFVRFETFHTRVDGRRIYVDFSLTPIADGAGCTVLLLPEGRDVTERHRAEAALREAIARHQAVLASTLDPIVTIDAWGGIQSVSNAIERVFGWRPEELIGRNVSVLMPEPHRSQHDGFLAAYRRTGQTNILGRTREFEAVRKDGRRFPIELSVSRVDVPGQAEPLFTGIIHDITERHELQRALAQHQSHLEELVQRRTAELERSHEQLRAADRLASIGTLAAGLGHDMNNVLLPIRCQLDALDAASLPPAVRQNFREVRRSIEYLQHLSDGLHLLALDPDDPQAMRGETDLRAWWSQVAALLRRAVPKHARLDEAIPESLSRIAVAPHRLTQAVLNLVVNAGEAVGPDGHVRVWAQPTDDRRLMRIGVTDNGHGMTPEVRKHALDPFFTTKKRGLGTGLGLSLVHGVAQSAGGSVTIDSEPGQGTTVVLELPVADSAQDHASARVLSATISLRDRRLASFVEALLRAAGCPAKRSEPASEPEGSIWVTDATPEAEARAGDFLARGGRAMIVFGPPSAEWRERSVIVVDQPERFETIRSAVGEAVQVVRDHPAGPIHAGDAAP